MTPEEIQEAHLDNAADAADIEDVFTDDSPGSLRLY